MTAVLTGLLFLVGAFLFDRYSARWHRVFSALCGAVFFAVVAFFLTANLGESARITAIVLSALAGGALMTWLLVTGIFLGGVFFSVLLAYTFVFLIPLPIPTLYWGYFALFLGICSVWKKHLAAQVLECAVSGILTALGGGFIIGSYAFLGIFTDPASNRMGGLVFVGAVVVTGILYGVFRIKTHRLEEVK